MSCPELTAAVAVLALLAVVSASAGGPPPEPPRQPADRSGPGARAGTVEKVTLFFSGDVMTARGIDQILPRPCDPQIHERFMKDARGYIRIAERANGRIDRPVEFAYIWGDALETLKRLRPHVRIINLETSVTRSNDYWKGKGIQYRMSPENVGCITAAGIDVCVLGNNHVLDWGYAGLTETLKTLARAGLKTAGAGKDRDEARAPAVCRIAPNVRVLVFSFACPTSGVPPSWAAANGRAGVHFLPSLSDAAAGRAARLVRRHRRGGDVVIASIHWGGNWGYAIPSEQRRFAHKLVESAGVDVVHGHSSHHVKAIEVHKGKLILYGCGDLINDYEGITGHESYRGDLGLMYFATVAAAGGRLVSLRMVPTQMRRLQLRHPSRRDAQWLHERLDRLCRPLGARVKREKDGTLTLRWQQPAMARQGTG